VEWRVQSQTAGSATSGSHRRYARRVVLPATLLSVMNGATSLPTLMSLPLHPTAGAAGVGGLGIGRAVYASGETLRPPPATLTSPHCACSSGPATGTRCGRTAS
jgi:hypothetical protein